MGRHKSKIREQLGCRMGIQAFLPAKQGEPEKIPEFKPSIMLSGAMQVVAGTIPDGYNMA